MPRRRKKKSNRAQTPAFLIVVQGEVTEREYFKRLKSHLRLPSLKIAVESHSPEKIVSKVRYQMANDKNAPYDHVFFVVDVDESKIHQFQQGIKQAKGHSNRFTNCSFVISNQCFEVWLLAHFEDLTGRSMERGKLTQKLKNHGGLRPGSNKHLSENFPIGNYEVAADNVTRAGLNSLGEDASSALPELLAELVTAAKGI